MKQYTTIEQTAKLIELGLPKPKAIIDVWAHETEIDMMYEYEYAYSIGELIKILEDFASIVMSYSYQKNGYYVRVIIPKREGGGMYRISQIELIDALYDMCVKLKEKGVI